jgi:hypothetical protein
MVSKILAAGIGLAFCGLAGAVTLTSAAADSALCEPTVFRVYFEADVASLSTEAEDLIKIALTDMRPCGELDVAFAADPSRVFADEDRRLTSERSVAVLSALRDKGFDGGVSVTTVNRVQVAAELNVGPDFVEVTLEPRRNQRNLLADAG